MARVVVVGSGIAGLVTAVRASRRHEVVLVTKAQLTESNTRYAQGGIAVVMFPDDTVSSHAADTLRAGAGMCDGDAVDVLCGEGPQRVRDLIALGVEFDRDGADLARGHEAAHSARRVLHAGGDATGFEVERALAEAVRHSAVEIHESTFVRDLRLERGRVVGVEVITPHGPRTLRADAVVIATGGAGQLYRHTTNPVIATGDGVAAAWRAGAVVADVEFVQFHPTALAVPGNPLISEAVRGEGAVLLDEHGHRFMLEVHPDGELAPRDVVARGIADAMARQGGSPVLLDATGIGRELLTRRFPGLSRATAEHGFDWTREPIPVTPAAHYLMGGIATDLDGRTSLPGLFAVGEAARTGVHGANRLASNSLLEGAVFGWRAAEALDGDGEWPHLLVQAAPHPFEPVSATEPDEPFTRENLQRLMWQHVGVHRTADGLRTAATLLDGWRAVGESVAACEDANLLDLARLVVQAALHREESRGSHFRADFPETSPRHAHSTAWVLPARAPALEATA